MGSSIKHLWCVVIALCAAFQLHAAPLPDDAARQSVINHALLLMPDELHKLVRGEQLIPTWREHGSQFWFAAELTGRVEYLRVDPESKSVVVLFDRGKLEAAVSKATVEAPALPAELAGFAYDFGKDEISFDHADRRWTYSSRDDRLIPVEKVEAGYSPDRRWLVKVRDYDLYLEDQSSGRERRLTSDGSSQQPYARPVVHLKDMVAKRTSAPLFYPEVVWAPDSSRFVTYRMNLEGARRLSAVQSTPSDGGPPRVFDYVYPMAGDERVPVAQTMIVDAASGTIVWVDSPKRESLGYGGPEFQWTRDGAAILEEIVSRGYGALSLYSIDPSTGTAAVLAKDESDRFVDFYAHHWKYVAGADAVAWLSEAQGWNHAFLIDRKGKRRQLTAGHWTVAELAGNDESGDHLFVVGRGREGGRDPYLSSLYRINRNGRGTTALTPEALDHEVYVSPDGRFFVDNQSLVDRPTTTFVRSTRDGAVLMKLQDADISELKQRGLILPERFVAMAADGVTPLYGVLYKPSTFDSRRRYPVIEYIYTAPDTFITPKSFTAGLSVDAAFAVAELGFVVVVVDGHGTAGRGRAFLDPAYRNLHAVGLDDHIAAIRALSAQRPYMDTTTVGVYGSSAGGYDVVRAMTERPDFYKVGVAASGNHDNRLDKAIWNEQWMGFPAGPQYDANSNITWAGKLEGKLFLAYGELDENVPPAATLRLVDALIADNKSFELLIVPNAGHFLGNVPYFNRRRFEFLMRNLSPAVP
ncbi:MAG: prolyl oligopeptidase family serine peptidase [Gammaproteobacteria bacterium]